jgi:hypothetical protein
MLCRVVMQRVSRKAMSSLLQSTLEAVVDVDKFPKASVDVNVLVLQVSPTLPHGCPRVMVGSVKASATHTPPPYTLHRVVFTVALSLSLHCTVLALFQPRVIWYNDTLIDNCMSRTYAHASNSSISNNKEVWSHGMKQQLIWQGLL